MGGAFGGLLELVERLGLLVQRGARHGLYLLIGDRAYEWRLQVLRSNQKGFKEQRFVREVLGAAAIFVVAVVILPVLFGTDGLGAVFTLLLFGGLLFVVAQAVRRALEEKAERDEEPPKD